MTPSPRWPIRMHCRGPKVEAHRRRICDTVRSSWFLTCLWNGCSAVYYRVYSEDGAIRSLHPLNPNDPSLSRIHATSVAPPHTAASLKRRLCRVEGVTGTTTLFTTTPDLSPMNDGDRITFLTEASPGVNSQKPMAFVVQTPNTERNIPETSNTADSPTEGTRPSNTRYRASVFFPYSLITAFLPQCIIGCTPKVAQSVLSDRSTWATLHYHESMQNP
jgi:hypothetical protein